MTAIAPTVPNATTWNRRVAPVVAVLKTSGWSHAQIASGLNLLGLKTWRGKPWSKVRVSQIRLEFPPMKGSTDER